MYGFWHHQGSLHGFIEFNSHSFSEIYKTYDKLALLVDLNANNDGSSLHLFFIMMMPIAVIFNAHLRFRPSAVGYSNAGLRD